MTLKQKYWKYVSDQLETAYKNGPPNRWSQKVIQSFLLDLDNQLIEICLKDNQKARRCNFRFTNKKEALKHWQSIDSSTFSRIFKYGKTTHTKDRTNDLFAIYFGYDSFEDLINKNDIKEDSMLELKEKKEEPFPNRKLNLKLILILTIASFMIIFGVRICMNSANINIRDIKGGNANIITGDNNEVHIEPITIYQNSEEEKTHRNIHDLSLYITHYLNSLLDSSDPKYFELKVKQIDTIKNELEKHLEFVGINNEIKIPQDTLESRYLIKEMIEFEKNEIKPKIRINLGEPHYYTYILSRNMWQYEYFFKIYQKTGSVHTQKAMVLLRSNITDLSEKVDFNIDRNELSSFLYDPTTESIDKIILAKNE